MKINKLFVAALAAMTMFSCAKEQGTENPAEGQETYAGISVSFPKMVAVRAGIEAPDQDDATTAEKTVTSVGVYVVDNNSGAMHSDVYTSGNFVLGDGTTDKPETDRFYLNTALKTTTGEKSIYVVLNPTATVKDEIAAKRGAAFSTASIAADETAFVNGTTDMVMSSTAAVTKNLTAVVSADDAVKNANLVQVIVQRNTAKVAVTFTTIAIAGTSDGGGTFTLKVGGTASNLEFAPITRAKNSFLIQKLAVSTNPVTVANVLTPGYTVDPVNGGNAYWPAITAPVAGAYQAVNSSTLDNNALLGFYALENVNATNMVGNTTAAIIKANIAVTEAVTACDASGVPTAKGPISSTSFYVYKKDNTAWTDGARTAAITAGIPASDFSDEYVGGVSFYRIWVKDDNGVVGVLRNNYYVMKITSISGFGSPTVPGTIPGEPPVITPIDEDTHISVEVKVLPWTISTSEHDL